MGIFDDLGMADELKSITKEENKFKPQELNEGNVQAIFNRCLAKDGTPKENVSRSILFSRTLGYNPSDEIVFYFDKKKLLDNKSNIEYLYGQLKNSHEKSENMSIDNAFYNYLGKKWTDNKAHLLEFLYLGCTMETILISPFNAKNNTTSLGVERIKPTISPKDPNFPEWWEKHKSEWEEPKKEGKEPADD